MLKIQAVLTFKIKLLFPAFVPADDLLLAFAALDVFVVYLYLIVVQ
jgi:hypothetical protein